MVVYLLLIIFVLIGQGIIFFEEETLILMCAIFLLDVLGAFLVRFVFDELEARGDLLKVMLEWYFTLKIEILSLSIIRHQERLVYVGLYDKLINAILYDIVDYVITQFVITDEILFEYEVENDLIADTLEISLYVLCYDLAWLLSVVEEHKYSGDIFIPESPYQFAFEILSVSE